MEVSEKHEKKKKKKKNCKKTGRKSRINSRKAKRPKYIYIFVPDRKKILAPQRGQKKFLHNEISHQLYFLTINPLPNYTGDIFDFPASKVSLSFSSIITNARDTLPAVKPSAVTQPDKHNSCKTKWNGHHTCCWVSH